MRSEWSACKVLDSECKLRNAGVNCRPSHCVNNSCTVRDVEGRRADFRSLSKLADDFTVEFMLDGAEKPHRALVDSGASISILKDTMLPKDFDLSHGSNITLYSAFGDKVQAVCCNIPCKLIVPNSPAYNGNSFVTITFAVTDKLLDDALLTVDDYLTLTDHHKLFIPCGVNITGTNLFLPTKTNTVEFDENNFSQNEFHVSSPHSTGIIENSSFSQRQTAQLNKLTGGLVNKVSETERAKIILYSDLSSSDISKLQREDASLKFCFEEAKKPKSQFFIDSEKDLLFRKSSVSQREVDQLVLPTKCRETVFVEAHTQFHLGINKTFRRISAQFYFPQMKNSVLKE